MPSRRIAVCLEVSPKQAVASALDWPGWCRADRDEGAALAALASYAGRYAPVAGQAGVSFGATVVFDVVERVPGGPATAFAAAECRRPFPQITAGAERAAVTPAAARQLASLVTAAWGTFDEIAAASPAELRKGPRGGGRDRDQLICHVIGAGRPTRASSDQARAAGNRRHGRDRAAAAAISPSRAPPPTANRWIQAAGPRATRPAGSPGTSWNMPGRSKTGRRARQCSRGGPARPRSEHDELGTCLAPSPAMALAG